MSLTRMVTRISKLRAARDMTQEDLARKAGVSVGYIARLETGRHDPKVGTLLKVAKALGVPVTELLE
jgi:transcriptional regulator with XRE-family HTH domain